MLRPFSRVAISTTRLTVTQRTSSRLAAAQRTGWLHTASSSVSDTPEFKPIHEIRSPSYTKSIGDCSRILVSEHTINCPLDYSDLSFGTIEVHATVVDLLPESAESSKITSYLNAGYAPNEMAEQYKKLFNQPTRPTTKSILYLQGGPGFQAPRPNTSLSISSSSKSSWVSSAFSSNFNRLVLLDQRGTGQSTPVTSQTLSFKFTNDQVKKTSDYLTNFRATQICEDAELFRKALHDDTTSWEAVIGQSYGGFCLATYLTTKSPLMIKNALFTGGIPPVYVEDVKEVYDKLWVKVVERNDKFYGVYPGDVEVVKEIVKTLKLKPQNLPRGGVLTARRFLQLGINLGGGPGAFEGLHELFATAFVKDSEGRKVISKNFLRAVEREQPFDTNPIYALLHESIYCERGESSRWAAERSLEEHEVKHLFDYESRCESGDEEVKVYFYGEMVFPWMFEDYEELVGLKEVAEDLARREDWGELYGREKVEARGACAIYHDDMYVDRELSLEVLDKLLVGVEPWITNEYQHSGLRDAGAIIFDKLLEKSKD